MFRNIIRPGVRTSTTIDPKRVLEDIDANIRTLDPEATPLQSLSGIFGTGPIPTSHKVQQQQYDAFDHWDKCTTIVLGTATNANLTRFAKLFLSQPSRPDTNSVMFYYPQDKFRILDTGQVVEVVMTPTSSIPISQTQNLILDAAFTGATGTTCEDGAVIVRNFEPYPMISFNSSDVVYLGRVIYESQDIEADPKQRDTIFDCNYVEHNEAVINMTEDQRYLVHVMGKVPDWDF